MFTAYLGTFSHFDWVVFSEWNRNNAFDYFAALASTSYQLGLWWGRFDWSFPQKECPMILTIKHAAQSKNDMDPISFLRVCFLTSAGCSKELRPRLVYIQQYIYHGTIQMHDIGLIFTSNFCKNESMNILGFRWFISFSMRPLLHPGLLQWSIMFGSLWQW